MRNATRVPHAVVGLAILACLGWPSAASAQTPRTWNVTSGVWQTGANWAGGSAPANDTTTNTAVFVGAANESSSLSAAASIRGLTFSNAGTKTISSDSTTARVLTLGASGITVNATSGAVTLGNATNTLNLEIGAGQTWTNNSANLLTVLGTVRPNVTTAGTFALTVTGSGNTTLSGALNDNSSRILALTKAGTGVLTLSGSNSYSGATTIQAGGLILDYSAQDNSKLGDAAALTLGSASASASLTLSGGSHVETVASTVLSFGQTTIARSGGSSTLRLNAITRSAGATIDFAEASLADTDTLNDATGILGAWATVAGTDWAMNSTNAADGAITAYTAYTDIDATGSTLADGSTTNVRLNAAGTGGNVQLGAATTAVNTLLQNATSAATVNMSGGTLRTSGIMIGSSRQSLTLGRAPGSGTLTAATAGGELVLINNSANPLRINALVADNTSASSLTKSGTGRVLLTGGASYTGPTALNAGTLDMRVLSGTTTLSGTISGPGGLVKSGGGALTLSGANTNFSGPLTLAAGRLNFSAQNNLSTGRINVTGNATLAYTPSTSAGFTLPATAIVVSDGASFSYRSPNLVGSLAQPTLPNILGGSAMAPIRVLVSAGDGGNPGSGSLNFGTEFRGNVYQQNFYLTGGTATLGHASNVLFVVGTERNVITFNNDVVASSILGGGTFNRRLFSVSTTNNALTLNRSAQPTANVRTVSGGVTLNFLPVSFGANASQGNSNLNAHITLGGGLKGTAGAFVDSFSGAERSDPLTLTVSSAAGDVYLSRASAFRTGSILGVIGINGPGRLTLQNDSGFNIAPVTLASSAFFTTTANVTTTGTITLGAGSTLRLAGAAGRLSGGSHAGAIVNNGSLLYQSGSNQTLSGVISGAGSLGLAGDGTVATGVLTLAGANTFTGATTLSAGGLVLDYATQDNSKLSDTAALTLGNAAISLVGGLHAETVLSTALTAGAASISRPSGAATLNLNAITRAAGSTLDLGAASIATTDTTNTNGILGGWATLAGAGWAVNSNDAADGAITALASYVSDTWSAGTNTTITGDGSVTDGQTGSLRFAEVAPATVTLSGTAAIGSGGILVTSNVGGSTAGLSGGAVRGSDAGELFVHQYNTGITFTIGSQIVDGPAATRLVKAGGGTLALTGSSGYTGGSVLSAGTLEFATGGLGSSGTVQIAGNSTLRWATGNTQDVSGRLALGSGVTATLDTNGNNVTLGSGFGGAGGLVKAGAGTLTLSGSNTFTGNTTISTGTLALGHAFGLGASTLDVNGAGRLSFGSLTAATLGGLTGSNSLVLENASGGAVAFTVGTNNAPTLTYSGVLSGVGSFEKTGYGRLILTGANRYSGPTTITNGYVTLSGGANRLPAGTNLSFANQAGAILDLNGQVQVIGALTGGGTTGGHVWVNAGTLFVGSAASGTYAGSFIDNGTIVKQGTGTLTLSGESTFGGTLQIDAGSVRMQGDNRLGLFYNPVIGAAGTLDLNGFSAMVGSLMGSGTVAMKDGTGALTVRSTARTTYAGRVIGFGALIKENSGWLTLTSAANDYSGGTQLAGGRLEFASGALGSTGQITVTTDPFLGGASVLRWLPGNTQDISSRLVIIPGVTATLDTNGNDVTFATGIGNGGFGSLTKIGLGTLSLAAANTFTGQTTVNAGTLRLDFAAAGAPSSNILSDESFLGFGGGTLLVRGASAGGSSQSLGNVTLNAGGGSLLVNPNGGSGVTVNLGTITGTAAGSALLVGTQSGAGAGSATLTTLTGTDSQGIYGGRVVFTDGSANGFNWATSTAASGVSTLAGLASGGYTALATAAGTDTANSRLTASATLGGSRTTNTLKVEEPAASQSLALGANTLTLNAGGLLATGSNGFTISSGTLTAGNGSGSYDLVVQQFNTGGLTISSVIGNNGANATSLTKAGSGNLTLSGANTFTGGVFLTSGTLTINHATALGTAASRLTIEPGTTIDNTSGAAASSLTLSSTNPQTWNGDFTYAGSGGRSLNMGTGAVTLGNDANLAVNGGTLTVGAIGGSGFGLTKSGAGSLAFAGANTFTGPLTVASGTVTSTGANMPNTDIVLADVSGAAIVLSTNAATIQSLAGGGSSGGNVAIAANTNLTIAGNASTTYGGRLTGGGGSNFLTKNGAGTLTLTNTSNSFTSIIRVNEGAVAFTSAAALGAGTEIQFNAGGAANAGRLVYAGTADTTLSRTFTMSTTTDGVIESAGTGRLILTGSVAASAGVGTLALAGTGTQAEVATLTQSSGVVSVNKTGPGLWRLTGNSNYSGRLTVLDGTIVVASSVASSNASPVGTNTTDLPIVGDPAATSGTAAFLAEGVTVERGFSVAATSGSSGSQVVVLGGFGTGTATFGKDREVRVGRDLTLQASDGGTAEFNSTWAGTSGTSGPGPAVVFTVGSAGNPGTVRFGSDLPSTLTGVSVVNGTAQLKDFGERIGPATPVTVGSNLGSATLDLNGLPQTLSRLTFAGNSGSVTTGAAPGGTLRLVNSGSVSVSGTNHVISALVELGAAASVNVNPASRLSITSAISGVGFGLTKAGAGILELSGTSDYSGVTTISGGSLLVNGQLSNTPVVVNSGGLLGGTGLLTGGVSVEAGGVFSPGNSPGLITTSTLSLAGTTLMEIDALSPRGGGYDAVDVTGLLTYGGSLVIDFGSSLATPFVDNTSFNLFGFGSFTGSFASITTAADGSYYGGLTFTGVGDKWTAEKGSQTLEFTHSTGNLVIVPEPGALALAAIGIAAAAHAVRRRSRG